MGSSLPGIVGKVMRLALPAIVAVFCASFEAKGLRKITTVPERLHCQSTHLPHLHTIPKSRSSGMILGIEG